MWREKELKLPEYTEIQKDYVKYRLDKSKEDLEAVHFLFFQGSHRSANNMESKWISTKRVCGCIFILMKNVAKEWNMKACIASSKGNSMAI